LRRILGIAQDGCVLRRSHVGKLEIDRSYGHFYVCPSPGSGSFETSG
jgi:hypothetical protein